MDRFYADKIYLQVCAACFPSVVTLSLLDLIFLYLLCNLILLDLAAVLAFTYFSRFPPCILIAQQAHVIDLRILPSA